MVTQNGGRMRGYKPFGLIGEGIKPAVSSGGSGGGGSGSSGFSSTIFGGSGGGGGGRSSSGLWPAAFMGVW